jgi:recombination associated protein RdgC
VMLAKTLTLDCPRGETGRDQLTTEGPTRLPEAFRAIQAGKLPRKAGLILVRHGSQYELTLQAETLAVSGAALPKIEGASGHDLQVARIDALRHLVETLDLLYDAYGRCRTGPGWNGELGRIRRWLQAA